MTLHQALGLAEIDGEISEFYALALCALLFPEFAEDYLEMAALVALRHEAPFVEMVRAVHRHRVGSSPCRPIPTYPS